MILLLNSDQSGSPIGGNGGIPLSAWSCCENWFIAGGVNHLRDGMLYQNLRSNGVLGFPSRLSGGETIKYDGIHAVSVERAAGSDGRVMWNGDYGRDVVFGIIGYFSIRLSK